MNRLQTVLLAVAVLPVGSLSAAVSVPQLNPLPQVTFPGISLPSLPVPMETGNWAGTFGIELPSPLVDLEVDVPQTTLPSVRMPVIGVPGGERSRIPAVPATVSPLGSPVSHSRAAAPAVKAFGNAQKQLGQEQEMPRFTTPALNASFDGSQLDRSSPDPVDVRDMGQDDRGGEDLPWVSRPSRPMTLPEQDLADEIGAGLGYGQGR